MKLNIYDFERLCKILQPSPLDTYAFPVALNLRNNFRTLSAVFNATHEQLMAIQGMDWHMADRIQAIGGLARNGLLPKPRTKFNAKTSTPAPE